MKTFEDIIEFHGHTCPGLALGYRVAKFALKEMGSRSGDEEIVAVVENNSCSIDAIQVITGCTFGKGNLIFNDYGKHVYTFFKRSSGHALRISVEWISPKETPEQSEAWDRYSKGDHAEDVLKIVHERKSRKISAIMEASDSALFKVSEVSAPPPDEAKIYPSLRCDICGEKTMEPRTRTLDDKIVCIPCFNEKGKTNE